MYFFSTADRKLYSSSSFFFIISGAIRAIGKYFVKGVEQVSFRTFFCSFHT